MTMTNNLYRLLYTSHCTIEGSADERARAVSQLADDAQSNNRARSLTGTLLYVQSSFIQVLEGSAEELETTFEKICCDFRHRSVMLIDLNPARERLFADWDMALLEGASGKRVSVSSELEEIQFLVGVNAREAMRQMRAVLNSVPA